jgi:hypothetical protein
MRLSRAKRGWLVAAGLLLAAGCRSRPYTPPALDGTVGPRVDYYLQALKEPLLFGARTGEGRERYRLVILRSDHPARSYRLEIDGGGIGVLYAKSGYPAEEGKAGRMVKSVRRGLSRAEVGRFKQLLVDAQFWQLPSSDPAGANSGEDWILEGRSDEDYQILHRHALADGPLRTACDQLIIAIGWQLSEPTGGL